MENSKRKNFRRENLGLGLDLGEPDRGFQIIDLIFGILFCNINLNILENSPLYRKTSSRILMPRP